MPPDEVKSDPFCGNCGHRQSLHREEPAADQHACAATAEPYESAAGYRREPYQCKCWHFRLGPYS